MMPCLIPGPRGVRDVKVVKLNGTQAQISWKRLPYTTVTNITYTVRIKFAITDEWRIRTTRRNSITINLKDSVSIVFAAVSYYDPISHLQSLFYPEPPVQLEISRKQRMC